MGINFNELPNSGGSMNTVVPEGVYYITIEKAEMKAPKNGGKEYLNMFLGLKDQNGKAMGKIWDIIADSDSDVVRYKLRRFIEALEIPITGEFELKDIAKIIQGKQLIGHITTDKRGDKPKSVIDVFADKIFYSVNEANVVFGGNAEINANDADDVPWNNPAPENNNY